MTYNNVNNSAGVTPGEPKTTNSHGIQASSLYCPNLFNNISVSATNAGVKRVTQRVSQCKYLTEHSAGTTTSGVNCTHNPIGPRAWLSFLGGIPAIADF